MYPFNFTVHAPNYFCNPSIHAYPSQYGVRRPIFVMQHGLHQVRPISTYDMGPESTCMVWTFKATLSCTQSKVKKESHFPEGLSQGWRRLAPCVAPSNDIIYVSVVLRGGIPLDQAYSCVIAPVHRLPFSTISEITTPYMPPPTYIGDDGGTYNLGEDVLQWGYIPPRCKLISLFQEPVSGKMMYKPTSEPPKDEDIEALMSNPRAIWNGRTAVPKVSGPVPYADLRVTPGVGAPVVQVPRTHPAGVVVGRDIIDISLPDNVYPVPVNPFMTMLGFPLNRRAELNWVELARRCSYVYNRNYDEHEEDPDIYRRFCYQLLNADSVSFIIATMQSINVADEAAAASNEPEPEIAIPASAEGSFASCDEPAVPSIAQNLSDEAARLPDACPILPASMGEQSLPANADAQVSEEEPHVSDHEENPWAGLGKNEYDPWLDPIENDPENLVPATDNPADSPVPDAVSLVQRNDAWANWQGRGRAASRGGGGQARHGSSSWASPQSDTGVPGNPQYFGNIPIPVDGWS